MHRQFIGLHAPAAGWRVLPPDDETGSSSRLISECSATGLGAE
jgi:hypothetical protein